MVKRFLLLLALVPSLASATIYTRQGYLARACGFDLDDDFIEGEPSDCDICDGTHGANVQGVDYDSDGVLEGEIYIDLTAGTNAASCGGPADPCLTIEYAITNRLNTQAGEDALCIKGTGSPEEVVPPAGDAGTKSETAAWPRVAAVEFPSQPTMIVGWDTDNDREYPPFDKQDVAVLDWTGNTANTNFFDADNARVEFAHLTMQDGVMTVSENCGGSAAIDIAAVNVYVHDTIISNWDAQCTFAFGGTLIGYLPILRNNDWLNPKNLVGNQWNYFLRGSPGDNTMTGPLVENNSATWTYVVNEGWPAFTDFWGTMDFAQTLSNHLKAPIGLSADKNLIAIQPGICVDHYIRNNLIEDWKSNISIEYGDTTFCNVATGANAKTNVWIDGNTFRRTTISDNYGFGATIQMSGGTRSQNQLDRLEITNNVFDSDQSIDDAWNTEIFICYNVSGSLTQPALIFANNTQLDHSVRAIWDSAPGANGCVNNATRAQWYIRNNYTHDSVTDAALWDFETTPTLDSDENAQENWNLRYNGTTHLTLSSWQSASDDDDNSAECTATLNAKYVPTSADACLLDQGTSAAAAQMAHDADIDNETRPRGASWDRGAQEAGTP